MAYIITLYLIIYAVISIYRLDWAVMVLIALLPSYLIRFHIFGVPLTLLEAMILTAFIIWLFKNWRGLLANLRATVLRLRPERLRRNSESKINRYPFDVEIILLLIISYGAAAVAGFSAGALGIWKAYFFEPLLVYILAVNVVLSPLPPLAKGGSYEKPFCEWGIIIWPLAISAFAIAAFAVFQKFTGAFIANPFWAAEATRRVTSFFEYPNAVGLYLGPIMILLLGFLIYRVRILKLQITNYKLQINSKFQIPNVELQKKVEPRAAGCELWEFLEIIFLSLTIILSLLAVYCAKSEGAIAGIAAGLIMFGLLAGKKSRWAVIAMAIVLSAGIAAYQPARNKAIEKLTLSDLSGEIRKQQWRETWQMLTASPQRFILGAGLDGYQAAVKPYHQEGIFFNKDNDPDFRRKIVLFDENYKKQYWQPVEIYLYPHNILLNFWSELGLVGVLLFTWIIGKYFYIGICNFQFSIFKQFQNSKFKIQNSKKQKYKYLNIGLISAMIMIIVHGLVDAPYFKNDLAVMFWLLVAMMGLLKIEHSRIDKSY